MRRFGLVLCVGVGVWGSQPRLVAAADDPEALIRIGNELRRKGDDKRAEGYIKRAYEIGHTPRAAAQLGLVELSLGRSLEAAELLTIAIDSDDAWVADHRSTLEASRAKARTHLVGVELVGAPRDATAVFADKTSAKVPADGVLWLEPGAIAFEVEAIGHAGAHVAVQATAGQRTKVNVTMSAVEQPAPPVAAAPPAAEPEVTPVAATPQSPSSEPTDSAPSPGRSLRIAGIAVGAAGVVAAAVGVVLLEKGNSEVDATNGAVGTSTPYDPSNANYKTLQGAGVGLIVGGVVAAAGGVGLYLLGRREESEPVQAVSFNVGEHFGLVQWGGRF
jgi:hypothetical protein